MQITHAVYYFLMEQFYFSGLTMATAVLLIMIYYVFGWSQPQFRYRSSSFGISRC